jgi:hypothetical protein
MSAKEQLPKQYPPVDTANDPMMVREGLHPPLFIQNAEWHRKTLLEKAAMANISKIKGLRASAPAKTIRTIPYRITVHLRNLKKEVGFKTTYSDTIYMDQVAEFMESFFGHMKNEIKVVYFNGKNITDRLAL